MNQEFKLGKLRESNTKEDETQHHENQSYADAGHVRNICFIWPDGRMKFLNYAYLVSGEYMPEDNKILLAFTSETIVLKGSKLDALFKELLSHVPKQVFCIDARYQALNDAEKYQVNDIEVLSNM